MNNKNILIIFILFFVVAMPSISGAIEISANTSANYTEIESITVDPITYAKTISNTKTSSEVVTANASVNLTRVLRVTGNITHIHNRVHSELDSPVAGIVETITEESSVFPYFSVYFNPPTVFYLRFSMSRNQNYLEDGHSIITSSMSGSFDYNEAGRPTLNISYNKNESIDTYDPHRSDNENTSVSLSSSYSYSIKNKYPLSVNLSYRPVDLSKSIDNLNDSESRHGQFSLGSSISGELMKKLNGNLSVNYSESRTKFLNTLSVSTIDVPLTEQNGLGGVDLTPLNNALPVDNSLIDGDIFTSTGFDIANTSYINVGASFNQQEIINKVYLYVSTLAAPIVTNYSFNVYSSVDGITWVPVLVSNIIFNGNRFEFLLGNVNTAYIKIVNTASPLGLPVNITEVQFYRTVLTENKDFVESVNENNSLNASLNYKPFSRLSMSYGFSLSQSSRKGDLFQESKSSSYKHSFNTSVTAVPKYLTLSGSYYLNHADYDNDKSTENDSTSVSVGSNPLDKLTFGAGYRESNSYVDDELTSDNNTSSLSTNFYLIDGINIGIGFSEVETQSYLNGTVVLKSNSTSTSIFTRLEPWSILSIFVSQSFGESESRTRDTVTGAWNPPTVSDREASKLTATLRPTKSIILSSTFDFEPESRQTHTLSWRVTNNFNLYLSNLSYSDFQSNSMRIGWSPFSRLSIYINYSESENSKLKSENELMSAGLNLSF